VNRFLGNVARDMSEHGLVANGPACVLVAVSGGVDSVVLLEVLHRLSGRGGWRLVVAHFNHQLRGAESDGDEQFVQALAKRLGWQCVIGRGALRKRATAKGGSLEMRAREARHQFLAATARTSGAACVALGHHADDQAELFLLRMLRGAGSEGFAGMKWSGPSSVDAGVRLIRPLLGRSREEIQTFARDWDLASRDDSSNDRTDILRNRIRKVLIPLLEKDFQPGLRRLLTREAEVLGAEAEYLSQASEEWLRGLARPSRPSRPFGILPLALQRRVLVSQLLKLGLAPEFELVESLRRHPDKNGGAVRLPSGKILQRTKAGLVILKSRGRDGRRLGEDLSRRPRAQRVVPSLVSPEKAVALDLGAGEGTGRAEVGGYRLEWRIREGSRPDFRRPRPGREWFDADKVGARIELRTWRSGDRFQPVGLPQAARLQNLFTNARVPPERRRTCLLATGAAGRIWWVDGLRIGEAGKITPATRRSLEWKWQLK
jgi:tRNA(Ile)-lysidine synthase